MKQSDFLKKFINDSDVGALLPTSQFGVRNICAKIDFAKDVTIVEYGPGDGVLTKYILDRMTPHSTLVAIETNPDFVNELRTIADPRLKVVHGSAERVREILAALGHHRIDYVLSGIPFSFFQPPKRATLVRNTYESLDSKGAFVVYQYSPLMASYLAKDFKEVTLGFVPLNAPPLFVMEAKKS